MARVTSRDGDQLLEFRRGTEQVLPEDLAHLPLEFACVVATYQEKVLFVLNPWRREWELPAGLIKQGEAPVNAARRELAEETGQAASSLAFAGLLLLRIKRGDRLEFGAVYTGTIDRIQPFQANKESAQIMFWDLHSPVDEHVNEIGWTLAKCLM